MIFFEKETDRCVYVDKYVEKRVFCVKNDMFSIKKREKCGLLFVEKKNGTDLVNLMWISFMLTQEQEQERKNGK